MLATNIDLMNVVLAVVGMDIVELNVGGRMFITTRATLCKHSGSMLAAMFSGDMQPAQQDKQGRFFLDRNGDLFATILSYLRQEPVEFPDTGIHRQALSAEASYFQLQELETLLSHGRMSNIPAARSNESLNRMQGHASKTTYRAGVAMLFSNAKDNIGFDEVHAICEAMVEAYFFRFEPAHANMGRLAKWVLWSRPKVTRVWLVDVTQSTVPDQEGDFRAHLNFTKKVANLAGISMDSFNGLLRTYLPIFQWEMKQRDFQLMTSCENHRMGIVSGWQLQRLASCPKP